MNAALVRLALLGFSGGFFIVPIAALLQHRPDAAKKGEVLAAANLLSFVGIFLASGAYFLLADVARLSPPQIFLLGGLMTLAGAVYVLFLLPDALLRFLLWAPAASSTVPARPKGLAEVTLSSSACCTPTRISCPFTSIFDSFVQG